MNGMNWSRWKAPSMWCTSSRNRSSVASVARIAFSAGGRRIATWIELKPPQDLPHIPTRPFDPSISESNRMISTASSSSCSEYSRGGSTPSDEPVPRTSTVAVM
jgi:hypothetical protein